MSPKRELSLDQSSKIALGRCLRELREMADLNQKMAASELGISPTSLCHIEQGEQEPRLQFIRKAARLYKVHPNTILGVIYLQEFYMEEFDPEGYLLAAAAGAVQLRQALNPQRRRYVQEQLKRLGYE